MIVTLGVMVVTSLLLAATFTLARSEIHLTSTDTSEKKAYYAAEAGIEDYEDHLTQDGNYLSYCTDPPTRQPGAQPGRRNLPSGHDSQHRSPANRPTSSTRSSCCPPNPPHRRSQMRPQPSRGNHARREQGAATGTFRIESTGYSGNAERYDRGHLQKR